MTNLQLHLLLFNEETIYAYVTNGIFLCVGLLPINRFGKLTSGVFCCFGLTGSQRQCLFRLLRTKLGRGESMGISLFWKNKMAAHFHSSPLNLFQMAKNVKKSNVIHIILLLLRQFWAFGVHRRLIIILNKILRMT